MTKARDLASSTPVPSTVSTTELGYVDGVTSAIQTQMDSKLATATASSTYQTITATGLVKVIPSSAVNGTVGATGTVTFSGASSVSLNGVFTSTYDHYRIVVSRLTSAANANINIRLRSGGTDESSGSNFYKIQYQGVYSTGTTFAGGNNGTTSWDNILYFLNTSDNGDAYIDIELENPYVARTTAGLFRTYSYQADTTTRVAKTGGMAHTAQVAYDGFSIIPTASTITGTIRVYGYNN